MAESGTSKMRSPGSRNHRGPHTKPTEFLCENCL